MFLFAFFLALFAISVISYINATRLSQRVDEANRTEREGWLAQDTTNAHMATHRGLTVSKAISPLLSYDLGSVSYHGTAIRVEAHRQHASVDPLQTTGSINLLNEPLSPALIAQLFIPLLIILLGYASVSGEIEQGTWGVLLTNAVSPKSLLLGKCVTIFAIATTITLPLFALALVGALQGLNSNDPWNFVLRGIGEIAIVCLYFAGWSFLVIGVSLRLSSSIASLALLLSIWGVLSLAMPRIAADVCRIYTPIPTAEEIGAMKESALFAMKMEQRHGPGEKGEHNRSSSETSSSAGNPEALRMIEMENQSNDVFDSVDEVVRKREWERSEWYNRFQFVSPFMAVRRASIALAATGDAENENYQKQVEAYRREMVDTFNRAELNHEKPGEGAERSRFWGRLSPFDYRFQSVATSVRFRLNSILCLLAWFAGTGAFLWMTNVASSRGANARIA